MAATLADRIRPVLLSLIRSPVQGTADAGRAGEGAPRVMIAVSGGVDSTVLLHLTRDIFAEAFDVADRPHLIGAHLDHGMREGSGDDARAVSRLCETWGIVCFTERVSEPPASETEARHLRYAFLDRIAAEESADVVLTAHHADDEIETLLHRMTRGTGLAGLRGIPRRRGPYCRPFLMARPPIRRRDLADWAARHALPVREDPSNLSLHTPRNRIRHRVLPELEQVRDDARASLLRLGRNARRSTAELQALADAMLVSRDCDLEIAVSVWQAGPDPLRRALLRRAMERMGVRASEAVTRAALRLPTGAQSGKGIDLPGGLRFERRFEHWVLSRATENATGGVVSIPTPDPGSAVLPTPGRTIQVVWDLEAPVDVAPNCSAGPLAGPIPERDDESVALDPAAVEFPLVVRGWRPGDRIARPFGHTSVAQWLSERRVPRRKRVDHVVVEDATGRLIAVAGLGAAHGCQIGPRTEVMFRVHFGPISKQGDLS